MRYLISSTANALYNDQDAEYVPLCIVTVEDDRVTGASDVEGGNPGVVDLVRDELEKRPASTLQEIVGMFGMAGAYKQLDD